MPPSLLTLWHQSLDFARRESPLLVPLALSTFAVGNAASILALGLMQAMGANGLLVIITLIGLLLVFLGQMAVTALVLKPGISVGESLKAASKALPKLILIWVGLIVILSIATIPVTLALQLTGFDPGAARRQALQAGDILIFIPVIILMIWMAGRLLVMQSALIEKNESPLGAVKASFALTKGNGLRLSGVVVGFALASQFVQFVAAFIASGLFVSLFKAAGSPFGGTVMIALAAGMAGAAPAMLSTIFAALYYRSKI
jgi:hypothetical protein